MIFVFGISVVVRSCFPPPQQQQQEKKPFFTQREIQERINHSDFKIPYFGYGAGTPEKSEEQPVEKNENEDASSP